MQHFTEKQKLLLYVVSRLLFVAQDGIKVNSWDPKYTGMVITHCPATGIYKVEKLKCGPGYEKMHVCLETSSLLVALRRLLQGHEFNRRDYLPAG